jgi:uncharacterized membrane protein YuzA (DUF378 family)
MKNLNIITQILLIVGGLNWGFVGAFSFDSYCNLHEMSQSADYIFFRYFGIISV